MWPFIVKDHSMDTFINSEGLPAVFYFLSYCCFGGICWKRPDQPTPEGNTYILRRQQIAYWIFLILQGKISCLWDWNSFQSVPWLLADMLLDFSDILQVCISRKGFVRLPSLFLFLICLCKKLSWTIYVCYFCDDVTFIKASCLKITV